MRLYTSLILEWKHMIKVQSHEHQSNKLLCLWKSQVGAKTAKPSKFKSMIGKIQYTAEIIEVNDGFPRHKTLGTKLIEVQRYLC